MRLERYPLRMLFWESTLKCNAFCEFCGSRCGKREIEDELTKEEICGVFRRVAEAYDAKNIMIDVSGGEPLMRKDLSEIMGFADSLGFSWGMVTNGLLLTDAVLEELGRVHIKTISVSIDGLQEVHDRIRHLPGGFRKIIENIRKLPAVPSLETVMITTVVSRQNIDQLPALREYLSTLPVHVWRVCPVDPIGRAAEREDICLDRKEMRQLLDFIRECRRSSLPFRVITSCSHFLGRYEMEVRDAPFSCYAGKQTAGILANGDIYVCSNVPRVPELIQGNVRRNDFVRVWEEGFAWFRDPDSRRKGKCRDCSWFSSCQGDSLHTWDFKREEVQFCMKDYSLEPAERDISVLRRRSLEEILDTYRESGNKLEAWRSRGNGLTKDLVVFSPEAFRQLKVFFSWGESLSKNAVEQAACLLGELFVNVSAEEEAFLAEVRKVIPIPAGSVSENTLTADDSWICEGRQLAGFTGEDGADGSCFPKDSGRGALVLLGFVHSHPGELTTAMSAGDFRWHRKLFRKDWRMALSVIVNPQKQLAAAYSGPAAEQTEMLLLL